MKSDILRIMRTGRGKAGQGGIRRVLAQRWLMKTSLVYWDITHTHTHNHGKTLGYEDYTGLTGHYSYTYTKTQTHTTMAKPLVMRTTLV